MNRSIMWTYIEEEKEVLERLLKSGQVQEWAKNAVLRNFRKSFSLRQAAPLILPRCLNGYIKMWRLWKWC